MGGGIRGLDGEPPKEPPGDSGSPQDNGGVDRGDRHAVELRGVVTLNDGSSIPVELLNLSYDGCGVETSVPLEPGTTLRLSTRVGNVDAEVVWCSGGIAGLHFGKHSNAQAHQDVAHVQRESERLSVELSARMKRFGKGSYVVAISDLSGAGCKFQFADRPEVGETVSITFDGLSSIEATVCWITGQDCGVDFSHSIHPAVIEMLVERNSRTA